jgi:hypothetical protein
MIRKVNTGRQSKVTDYDIRCSEIVAEPRTSMEKTYHGFLKTVDRMAFGETGSEVARNWRSWTEKLAAIVNSTIAVVQHLYLES